MTNPIISSDGSRDFDFFLGHWRAKNHRLAERFQGSTEWTTFEANHHCVPLLDGVGNMDELRADEQGVLGMSIRFFNKTTKLGLLVASRTNSKMSREMMSTETERSTNNE